MTKPPSDALVEAWIALMRAQQVGLRRVEQAFKDAGLPGMNVYDVLWELEQAGKTGLRPFELEHRMLFEQSNVSRLIERLAREGLVERRPAENDGRGHLVNITPAGRSLRKRMWAIYAPAIVAAMGPDVSDDDAQALTRLLRPLLGHSPMTER